MDKHMQYILSLGFLMMLTTVSLSALKEARLDVYISLYTVAYFASSALFTPRRKWYDVVGGALFMVFCYIVALKIMEILF
jgi:hypothetical protein